MSKLKHFTSGTKSKYIRQIKCHLRHIMDKKTNIGVPQITSMLY